MGESFKIKTTSGIYTLNKGKYVISDPCYLYPDNKWDEFCDQLWKIEHNHTKNGVKMIDDSGNEFLTIGTAYGDGGYPLYENGVLLTDDLCVDSGLLSVIPLEVAKSWGRMNELNNLGYIIELKEDTIFSAAGGNFSFGWFEVFTGDNPYDLEDESDDEEHDGENEFDLEDESDKVDSH